MGKGEVVLTIILFNLFFILFIVGVFIFIQQYKLKISPLGVLYTVMEFRDDFFEIEDMFQKEHMISELSDLFKWMQLTDLASVLNYSQRRIDYRDPLGNLQESNFVVVKFTFKTRYIKFWRIFVLYWVTYFLWGYIPQIKMLINNFSI